MNEPQYDADDMQASQHVNDFCRVCQGSFSAPLTGEIVALRSLGNLNVCCECWDRIRPRHCDNCCYFHQWLHLIGSDDGACRIHAITHYGFPPTTKSNWCGEWKNKQ